ncbi:Mobile element protein, partial [uncultured Synechococcales cyanobacterium]
VRKAKRLAAYLNALRPLCPHILQRYLHRGNRYLLARSM